MVSTQSVVELLAATIPIPEEILLKELQKRFQTRTGKTFEERHFLARCFHILMQFSCSVQWMSNAHAPYRYSRRSAAAAARTGNKDLPDFALPTVMWCCKTCKDSVCYNVLQHLCTCVNKKHWQFYIYQCFFGHMQKVSETLLVAVVFGPCLKILAEFSSLPSLPVFKAEKKTPLKSPGLRGIAAVNFFVCFSGSWSAPEKWTLFDNFLLPLLRTQFYGCQNAVKWRYKIKLQFLSGALWQELAVHDSSMISAEGLRRLLLGLGIEPQRNGHPAEIMVCTSLVLPWSFSIWKYRCLMVRVNFMEFPMQSEVRVQNQPRKPCDKGTVLCSESTGGPGRDAERKPPHCSRGEWAIIMVLSQETHQRNQKKTTTGTKQFA